MSISTPFMYCVSSMLPPSFFSSFMKSLSMTTLPSFFSDTCFIAWITSFERYFFVASVPMFFEPTETRAILSSFSLSSMCTGSAQSSSSSAAFACAISYPFIIVFGFMPFSIRSPAFFRSSPAIMTAVVVPSPTSLSWVFAISTMIFATGCSTFISSSIVAPSLVITMSPSSLTSILSMPFGPSVVLIMLATA